MTRFGRFSCAAIAALLIAGCDDNPASPSANPTVVILTSNLTPGNEVPPVTNADSSGRGTVRVTLDLVRDGSGAIASGTASFLINLSGFPAGTVITGAHIHPGAAGVNGGVVVNSGMASSNAANPLAAGTASLIFNSITVSAALLQELVNNPANYYFNVHTTLNPAGAVRGQLQREN